MAVRAALDVRTLTRFANKRHPLWWGILMAVTIEAVVVTTLIACYGYLWFGHDQWPPPDAGMPDVILPSINTVLLIASAGTMYWAGWGINRNKSWILTIGTGASVVLASTVLAIRSYHLSQYSFRWDSHAYGSIVWVINGFHYVHVTSAIVGTAVVTLLAWRRYFTPERQLGVVVDTLYWYFVAGAWLPLYFTLYWVHRIV